MFFYLSQLREKIFHLFNNSTVSSQLRVPFMHWLHLLCYFFMKNFKMFEMLSPTCGLPGAEDVGVEVLVVGDEVPVPEGHVVRQLCHRPAVCCRVGPGDGGTAYEWVLLICGPHWTAWGGGEGWGGSVQPPRGRGGEGDTGSTVSATPRK